MKIRFANRPATNHATAPTIMRSPNPIEANRDESPEGAESTTIRRFFFFLTGSSSLAAERRGREFSSSSSSSSSSLERIREGREGRSSGSSSFSSASADRNGGGVARTAPCPAGTVTTSWHWGQRIALPASSSLTAKFRPQPQVNRIAIGRLDKLRKRASTITTRPAHSNALRHLFRSGQPVNQCH
jgi:hypothetical protein